MSKRRVLGDITNSSNAVVPSDYIEAKKPVRSTLLSGVLRKDDHQIEVPVAGIAAHSSEQISSFGQRPPQPPALPDRAYMLRDVDDIDCRDSGNPLLVTGLVNEMYQHFQQLELDNRIPAYMKSQEYINEAMRAILVDWLVSVR